MTEIKQIVGRGTRVHEDSKKFFFTLIDFRGATNHFANPDFDGDPVQIYEPGEADPIMPPDEASTDFRENDQDHYDQDDDEETVLVGPGWLPGVPDRKITSMA